MEQNRGSRGGEGGMLVGGVSGGGGVRGARVIVAQVRKGAGREGDPGVVVVIW